MGEMVTLSQTPALPSSPEEEEQTEKNLFLSTAMAESGGSSTGVDSQVVQFTFVKTEIRLP